MMTETRIDKPTAEHLAAVLAVIRPDWDPQGTIAAIGKVRDRGLPDVTIAAVLAAIVDTNRTPAVIAMDGDHWRDVRAALRTPADRHPSATTWDELCHHCGSGRPVCQSERMQDQDPHPYKTRWDMAIDRKRADQREAHAESLPEWTPDGHNPGRIPAVHRQTIDAGLAEGWATWQRRLADTSEETST